MSNNNNNVVQAKNTTTSEPLIQPNAGGCKPPYYKPPLPFGELYLPPIPPRNSAYTYFFHNKHSCTELNPLAKDFNFQNKSNEYNRLLTPEPDQLIIPLLFGFYPSDFKYNANTKEVHFGGQSMNPFVNRAYCKYPRAEEYKYQYSTTTTLFNNIVACITKFTLMHCTIFSEHIAALRDTPETHYDYDAEKVIKYTPREQDFLKYYISNYTAAIDTAVAKNSSYVGKYSPARLTEILNCIFAAAYIIPQHLIGFHQNATYTTLYKHICNYAKDYILYSFSLMTQAEKENLMTQIDFTARDVDLEIEKDDNRGVTSAYFLLEKIKETLHPETFTLDPDLNRCYIKIATPISITAEQERFLKNPSNFTALCFGQAPKGYAVQYHDSVYALNCLKSPENYIIERQMFKGFTAELERLKSCIEEIQKKALQVIATLN